MRTLSLVLMLSLVPPVSLSAQAPVVSAQHPASPPSAKATEKVKGVPSLHLASVRALTVRSESAGIIMDPMRCDEDGNLYLKTDDYGVAGIRKLNPKGERIASFQATANPDFKVNVNTYFAIGPAGSVYELVNLVESGDRIFVYKSDGTYKSALKLESGHPWANAFAVFPSGNLLVTGMRHDSDPENPTMWPFTGIFSSNGSLLKELSLKDDGTLRDLAASGDARVTSPTNPWANHAINFSKMQAASDGNIYLMRWTSPAIVYAVSEGGAVRRFTVDPGDKDLLPTVMHISGSRMAVLFVQPQTRQMIIKIVDLEGRDIATYEVKSSLKDSEFGILGTAFACYTANPESFTFFRTDDEDHLQLVFAEAR